MFYNYLIFSMVALTLRIFYKHFVSRYRNICFIRVKHFLYASLLESDSGFEDGNFPVSFLFVVYETASGDLQYESDKLLAEAFH